MNVIAIYNVKGGVGKTTAAVNLSYLSATTGRRTLLWDLDPQAASSFAFRVRPQVAGFGKKSLEDGAALADAIKETDYDRLDLLPADFAYRKLDRLLGRTGHPHRVWPALVSTIGREYDAVFLDCPPGISRLTDGVFASATVVLVPTIPTVLSLRMLAGLMKWSGAGGEAPALAALLSMVDHRKRLHRRTCLWAARHPEVFLSPQIPYASIVEQMAVRRMPLPVLAPSDAATAAFRAAWSELQTMLERGQGSRPTNPESLRRLPRAIESLIAALETDEGWEPTPTPVGQQDVDRATAALAGRHWSQALPGDDQVDAALVDESAPFVHRFDTDRLDLEQGGCMLELRERSRRYFLTIARADAADSVANGTEVQIDGRWAVQILSGTLSPLAALERRLGDPAPLVHLARSIVGSRRLRRVESRLGTPVPLAVQGRAHHLVS
jgi:chromosome partitioning protein